MVAHCPSENAETIDQSSFWGPDGVNWTPHRIGWAVSGGCALLTTIITICHVATHARNYRVPAEQRQIIRILYMPTVFAIISWLSYRFFRAYTYYSLAQIAYEAFTISAFLLLIIQYVAATAANNLAESALVRKGKEKLPLPFCCWRYRPTKPYFMYAVKWSVMQYVIIRPAASVAGIITEHYHVLCESSYSWRFANVYIASIDFVSISVALYGLILFYGLTKDELNGKRPLAKFLCIKLIVFFTFYQSFVFSALQKYGIIKATEYWTASNITDGLNALVTTVEMVFFAGLMAWAYPAAEYAQRDEKPRGAFRAIWDSLNFSDFAVEIYTSLRFFWHAVFTGKSYTRQDKNMMEKGRVDFSSAFLEYEPRSSSVEQSAFFNKPSRGGPGISSPNAVYSRDSPSPTTSRQRSVDDGPRAGHVQQGLTPGRGERIGMHDLGRRI